MESKTKEQVLQIIEEEDIKFIRLQFADFFGVLRNIAVTGSGPVRAPRGVRRVRAPLYPCWVPVRR